MKQLLIYLLFIIPVSSFAQTTIANYEKVSGKWNRQGSPYLIEGEAIVPAGKTLTIEPGTVVLFKTGTNTTYGSETFDVGLLRVRGQLIARGTEERMITFGRNGEDGKWGQIYIQGQEKESQLTYCKISHAQYLRDMVPNDNGTAAVTFYRCGGEVSHCIISDSWAGVNGKKEARPNLFHNVFINNKYALEANSNSRLVAHSSLFVGNEADFYLTNGGKIELSHSLISEESLADGVENGEGMIFGGSPIFVNGEEGDYHLAAGSPGIRAGKGNADMGAFPDAHTSRVKKDPALAANKRRRRSNTEDDIQPQSQQAPVSAGKDPHYHALLIGVKSYDDREIDRKKKAHRQVRKLRSLLTHNYGFVHENVLLLENPTKAEIVAELERLTDQLGADDHLLICYTGQFEWDEYHQTGYWLPHDARKAHSNTWLSEDRLSTLLSYAENKHTLVLSDTPFGSLSSSRSRGQEADNLQVLQQRYSRKAIVKRDPTPPKDPDSWMQGLLQMLATNQSPFLTSEIILTRLAMRDQEGQFTGGILSEAGDEGGEFLLRRR